MQAPPYTPEAPIVSFYGYVRSSPSSLVFRMAQSSRTASSSSSLSDDPMEKLGDWFQSNSRPIGMAVGGVAIAALVIFGYRSYTSGQNEKASTALYAAQAPMAQGKLDDAIKALERVVKGYSGTAAGQQASLLLAQTLFEQKKYAEGVASLEKSAGGASADFKASMESMIAVGYELQGKFADAALHYSKASSTAKFDNDKLSYKASEARSLMSAGKNTEATKLWVELSKSDSPSAQEANVRLGELAGAVKK